MKSSDVSQIMGDAGCYPAEFIILDDEYECPTKGWVLDEFAPFLGDILRQIGTDRWVKNRNDCDKFSRQAWAQASAIHVKSTDKEAGLTFGIFNYERDAGGGHSINFFIVQNGNKAEVCFFEPQTQQQVYLSVTERAACMSYIV
jgi:hypothetical protein